MISGGDSQVGRLTVLTVSGLPEGAKATVYGSRSGIDGQTCPNPSLCFGLVDGFSVGEVVAGATGDVEITWPVPDDAAPGPVWFQAVGVDPAGARSFSVRVLRAVAVAAADRRVSFESRSTQAGVSAPVLVSNGYTGALAWVDINNDWWPDLVVSNGSGRPRALFLNQGDGTFSDFSYAIAKSDPLAEDAGVTVLDVDADGLVDLFFPVDAATWDVATPDPSGGPNTLHHNLGGGAFEEVAEASGLVDPRGARTSLAAATDRDGDGDVDLFLGTWSPGPNVLKPVGDRLLDGVGDLFVEPSDVVGLLGFGRDTSGATWIDVDDDGRVDLLNTLHGVPSLHVHLAEGGSLFTLVDGNGPPAPAWGLTPADFDQDGLWDLVVWGEVSGQTLAGSQTFRGLGDGNFEALDCSKVGGCLGTPGGAAVVADLDRDGRDDLLAAGVEGATVAFLYEETGQFLAHADLSSGASALAAADFDGDFDVDVATWSTTGGVGLLANSGIDGSSAVAIGLVAPGRVLSGTVVEVTTPTSRSRRVVGGFPLVEAGIGAAASAEVAIRWPDGTLDLGEVAAGAFVLIAKGEGVRDEVLSGSATWSASTRLLTIAATSTHGGRTSLASPIGGVLAWDAGAGAFQWEGLVDAPPPEIGLLSARGAAVSIPVSVGP